MIHIRFLNNKAFVGLGSRDNVQTEMSIFKYANCQGFKYKELIRPAGLPIWFVQLVHQAGPSSWSVYKVKVLIFVHGKGNSREKLVTGIKSVTQEIEKGKMNQNSFTIFKICNNLYLLMIV